MKYLSVCSGIEAATTAWHSLGWQPVAFAEIEKFPSAVLAHHWPDVPNLGDMTKYDEWKLDDTIDLLVGGTPCQSFSVAGLRKGLADPRGNLTLTFLGMVDRFRPKWLLWENVPGVLSDKGNAFGQFLSGLAELGYEYAYRVLDAQHFGVPQRRRRVFVVGCPRGSGVHPAEVLFEPESLCRDLTPSREARERVAGGVENGVGGSVGSVAHALTSEGFDASEDETGRGTPLVPQIVGALTAKGPEANGAPEVDADHYLPQIVGALSDGAHHGGGLNGQDAYTGRIIPAPAPSEGQTPVPVAFPPTQDPISSTDGTIHAMKTGSKAGSATHAVAIRTANTSANGHEIAEDVAHTIDQVQGQAVAFGVSESPETAHCLRSGASKADKHESTTYVVRRNMAGSGGTSGSPPAVAFSAGNHASSHGIAYGEELNPPIRAGASGTNQAPTMAKGMAVRRLTPTECERLQGFPDGHTRIPWRGKDADQCPDGPRYKALGNSMAVPVMRWIGERITKTQ